MCLVSFGDSGFPIAMELWFACGFKDASFLQPAEDVTRVSQNATQRKQSLSVSLGVRADTDLIERKASLLSDQLSQFTSYLRRLELFHNTDDLSAPRAILPPTAANIEAAYSNTYPIKMY